MSYTEHLQKDCVMLICILRIAKDYGMILSASMAIYVTGDWERIKIFRLSCASWVNTEGKPYNGDEDGIAVIADENLRVWSAAPTKKTHHQSTVFSMFSDVNRILHRPQHLRSLQEPLPTLRLQRSTYRPFQSLSFNWETQHVPVC